VWIRDPRSKAELVIDRTSGPGANDVEMMRNTLLAGLRTIYPQFQVVQGLETPIEVIKGSSYRPAQRTGVIKATATRDGEPVEILIQVKTIGDTVLRTTAVIPRDAVPELEPTLLGMMETVPNY
jgi:hypothetical protein